MAGAQVLSSCEQWADYLDGTYCVYNNKCGDNAGAQCITATSTTAWSVKSNQTGTGVNTYPNSSREPLGVAIGPISSLTSSMNTTSPGTGDYCTAWDIWAPTEIMIWINKSGSVAPRGSFVETAIIGGVDIVDALVVAQYYVGLITRFCYQHPQKLTSSLII